MKKIIALTTLLLLTSTYIAFSQKLVGTWNIKSYKTVKVNESGYTLSDIGAITFYKDNTGANAINYSVLGMETTDHAAFKWTLNQDLIALQGERSAFVRTWIITESKSKYQKWQSTDGKETVYVLELEKQGK